MGLRLTLIRNELQRLCCGRVGRMEAAGAARRRSLSAIHPPLAVRAGVDTAAAAHDAEVEGTVGQRRAAKRQRVEAKDRSAPQPRPDHFLALQVSQHPQVCAAITQVHASIREHAPHLGKACVDAASAHLTLGVMALPRGGERAQAARALSTLGARLEHAELLGPVEVTLEGLSHFRNQVLYLDMRRDEGHSRLMALAAEARTHFQEAGLLLQADQAFVPHVTIAKTSKLQQGGWGKGRHGRGRGRGARGRGLGGRGGRHEGQEGGVEGEGAGAPPAQEPATAAGAVEPVAAEAAAAVVAAGSGAAHAESITAASGPHAQQQQEQRLSWREIPPEAWAQHAAISGGTAVLAEVQLCAMQGRKPGGYYTVIGSLPLAAGSTAADTLVAGGAEPGAEPDMMADAASGSRQRSTPAHGQLG